MQLHLIVLLSVAYLASCYQISELKCWVKRPETHYAGPGLQLSKNIDDTVECANACLQNGYCTAIDIDTNTNPNCWYQQKNTFVASIKDLKPAKTVTNYIYSKMCGMITEGVDLSCWTVTPAHQIMELKQIEEPTLDGCLKTCIVDDGCWTVDWDVKSSPSCWVQKIVMEVSASKLKQRDSVTNFMLDRNCLKLTSGIDMRFWFVSVLTGYASPGLVQVQQNDLSSCLSYCQKNPECNMVDFDPPTNPPCWAQTKAFTILKDKLVDSKTCYNFVFRRKEYELFLKGALSGKPKPSSSRVDVSSIISSSQKTNCWSYQDDVTYSGAGLEAETSVSNLDKCLEKCYDNPSCQAVIFAKNLCSYVIGNKKVTMEDFDDKAGVVSYIPDRNC